MANLYRKSMMDKLSSPEKLDQSIIIISPSFWIAAIGGLVIIAVALVWSIFGRLPVNVSAGGMYMGSGGLQSVVSDTEGIVQDVYVHEGDMVEQGQDLAQLDSSIYDEQIAALNQRKENVECVTFWSYDDPATADTKPLIDIKAQSGVADSNLSADQIALKERYKALSKQRKAATNAKATRDSALNRLNNAQAVYASAQSTYNSADAALKELQITYNNLLKVIGPGPATDAQKAQLEALEAQIVAAQNNLNSAAAALEPAQAEAKKAESAYSIAEQTYNTEKSKKQQLEDTISQMEAKVKADKSGAGKQVSALEKQFNAAKGSVIDQIDQELKKQQAAADKMKLKSRADGKVAGVNVAKGNIVQAGMTICTVIYDTGGEETVLFVPVSEGKKIKKGMKVVVYPSTVNRQEYGHMQGTVTRVSDTVVSSQDMTNQLGDQSLAQAFSQTGPVIRVSCSLEKDKSTASGYKWSSKKGAEVALDSGTIVQADIVTDEKAPISMLIPFLKEKFSVKTDQNAGGGNANGNASTNNSNNTTQGS